MPDRKSLALLALGLVACLAPARSPCPPGRPTRRRARAYVVGEMTVKDLAGYRAYGDKAAPIIRQYGGKFLVRGGQTVPVEGAAPARIVIIEFPSLEQARKFEYSPEYTAIAPMRPEGGGQPAVPRRGNRGAALTVSRHQRPVAAVLQAPSPWHDGAHDPARFLAECAS